jgi:hypothetical protein
MPRINGKPVSSKSSERRANAKSKVNATAKAARDAAPSLAVASPDVLAPSAHLSVSVLSQLLKLPLSD